jgi:RecA-family ATPase
MKGNPPTDFETELARCDADELRGEQERERKRKEFFEGEIEPFDASRCGSAGASKRDDAHGDPSGYVPPGKAAIDWTKLPPLKILRPEEWYDIEIPERRWAVPNWLPYGTVIGLYGDGGVGKSTLAMQLQAAGARGGEWCGMVAEPFRSLGLYCEDDKDELQRRHASIAKAARLSREDAANMRMVSRYGEDNLLMTFTSRGAGELTPLHKQVIEQARDERAQLVIWDTVSDGFAGNENDRTQVRQFVQTALGSIVRAIDGTVVALAHPSRSGLKEGTGESGSTGWNGAFRARAFFARPQMGEGGEIEDSAARILSLKKSNYGPPVRDIKLRWRDGAFVFHPETGSSAYKLSADDIFLQLLDKMMAEGVTLSRLSKSSNYAPRLFANRPERAGYNKHAFTLAMERLFAAGKLRLEDYLSSRKPYQRIVRS